MIVKKNTKLALLAAAAMSTLLTAAARADLLAGWDFSGVSGGTSPFAPTNAASGVTVGGLTRTLSAPASPANNAWGASGFSTSATSAAAAIAANNFFSFSFTDATAAMSFSAIDAYNIRRSNTGPNTGIWQYQIGSSGFVDIGSNITWGTNTSSAGNLQGSIALSGISALQNVAAGTTVTFRVVDWGASNSGGTWYFNNFQTGNDLVIQGTTSVVVPPGSGVYWVGGDTTLGGSGVWETGAGTAWRSTETDGAGSTWDPALTGNFGGTNSSGNGVTVNGTITANKGFRFQQNGYTVSGGTAIDLAGATIGDNTITVDNLISATVATPLTGSHGMTKSGAGTLILTYANTYTGSTSIASGTLQIGDGTTAGSIAGDVSGSGKLAFNHSDDVNYSGNLTGGISVAQMGAGTLTLSGTNTYTGGTFFNAGVIAISANAQLGNNSGALNFAGGTLKLTAGGITSSRNIAISTTGTIDTNGNDLTLSGTWSGTGTFIKAGTGNLTLTTVPSPIGADRSIRVEGGTLTLNIPGTIANYIGTEATGTAIAGNLVLQTQNSYNLKKGNWSGGGLISVVTTNTTIQAFAAAADPAPVVTIGNNIRLNSTVGETDPAGAFEMNFSADATSGSSLTLNGVVSGAASVNFGNRGTSTFTQRGKVYLNAVNTWTGNTNINMSTGEIVLGVDNAIPTTSALTFGSVTGNTSGPGNLDLGAHNQTVASLSTGASVVSGQAQIYSNGFGASTLTINGSVTPANPFNGWIKDGGAVVSLVKSGTNTITLSGTDSTYSGGTTINGGALIAANGTSGVAMGSIDPNFGNGGWVHVNNGGSLGGGTAGGTVGATTVASGGKLLPGGLNTAGLALNFSSSLTLEAGSIVNFDFSGASKDKITVGGELTLPSIGSGTVTININDLGSGLAVSPITLFSFGSISSWDPSQFVLGTPNPTLSFTRFGNELRLVVSTGPAALNWTGASSNVWDVATSTNFDGSTQKFTNGDQATFGDGASNSDITIASGGVSPNGVFVSGSANYSFSGDSITGSTSLTKSGTGTLTLNNTNTFTGGVFITGGTLKMNSAAAIGSASAVTISSNAVLQAGATLSTDRSIILDVGGGMIDSNGNEITLTGVISGTSLTKSGAGTLVLTNTNNSYVGGTTIAAGTLSISDDAQLGGGTLTLAGGVLKVTASGITSLRNIAATALTTSTIDTSGNDLTLSGVWSGTGGVTKVGAGNLTLTTNLSPAAGTDRVLRIEAGTLTLASSATSNYITTDNTGNAIVGDLVLATASSYNLKAGTWSGGGLISTVLTGTTIQAFAAAADAAPVVIIGNNIRLNSGTPATDPAGVFETNFSASDADPSSLTLSGVISGASNVNFGNRGTTNFTQTGAVILNAVNTWTGATNINMSTGSVVIGIDDALPTGTAVTFGSVAGNAAGPGTLDLAGHNQTIASLSAGVGSVTAQGAITNSGSSLSTLTINGNVTPANGFNGAIMDGSNGAIALIKSGSHTLTLSSSLNNYSGGTSITAGKLIVANTAGSATGTGTVTVSGTGILAGTGFISGAVNVTTGSIAPGSSIGTLTISNELSLAGIAAFEINDDTTTNGKLVGITNITFGGALNITNLGSGNTFVANQTFDLFDWSGTHTGSFSAINLPTLPGTLAWDSFDYATGEIKVVAAGGALLAGSGAWHNGSGTGIWTTNTGAGSNWMTGVPSTAGQTAQFDDTAVGGAGTVDMNGSKTLGGITINSSGNYNLGTAATSDKLILNNSGSGATLAATGNGNHTVNAQVVLADSSTISAAAGTTLSLAQGIDNALGNQLTFDGGGTINAGSIEGAIGTSAQQLSSVGVTTLAGNITVNATRIREATLNIGTSLTTTGAKLKIVESSPTFTESPDRPAGNNAFVSVVKDINIYRNSTSSPFVGTLDITNNDIIIDYTDSNVSPLSKIEEMVKSGYNSGTWTGTGITSSIAAANPGLFTVAVADNQQLGGVAIDSFDGINTTSHKQILVKFTWIADINLDGFVNSNDAIAFATFYSEGLTGAHHMTDDLNYDGTVNFNDAIIFATTYNASLQSLPEPASLGMLAIGAAGLLMRRRRN